MVNIGVLRLVNNVVLGLVNNGVVGWLIIQLWDL